MDTIDVSNLNRQFLFRARHVGQPKASVAAAAAAALAPEDVDIFVGSIVGSGNGGGDHVKETTSIFIPKAQVTPHRGDVRSSEYGASFFAGFDLVLNGLDNVAARRHVNRLCLAAKVPLVESGTAGHLGQVTVHFKKLRDGLTLQQQREEQHKEEEEKNKEGEGQISTECYECQPKPTPKSFPVCTIRSTPEKPIHCVVWAKELLFSRLVGPPEAASDLEEEGGKEEAEGAEEPPQPKPSLLRGQGETVSAYCSRVFSRLFDGDVRATAALDELWEARPRPVPLPLDALLLSDGAGPASPSSLAAAVEEIERAVVEKASTAASSSSFNLTSFSAARALGLSDDHARWPVQNWAKVFVGALAGFHSLRASDVGALAFDKDDRLSCELVCSGAALRAAAFHINGGEGGGIGGRAAADSNALLLPPPPITLFEAKGMAGNIIHALATTNAVVAGLIAAEALKLVAGAVSSCKVTWIRAVGGGGNAGGGRLLVAGAPPCAAANCAVCGSARLELGCDPSSLTLAELINDVLKGRLALIAPTLISGSFYWEDPNPSNGECDLDEDEIEQYSKSLPTALAALPGGGLSAGSVVAVKDQAQAIDLQLLIVEKEKKEEKEEGGGEEEKEEARFVLRGAAPVAAAAEEGREKAAAASPSSSSDLEILTDQVAAAAAEDPEVPDAVDAAEALAAEEASERKEEEASAAAAAAAAAATAAAATEQPAEEEEKPEEKQPSPEQPPPTKRPRRAAAERGRQIVREAIGGVHPRGPRRGRKTK